MATFIYIGSDNSVVLDGLEDATTGTYINAGATVTFTLYRLLDATGTTTAESATITLSEAAVVAGDVNRKIVVTGAGDNGSDLRTTIATVVSATEATLASAASVAVADAAIRLSITGATAIDMAYVAASNGKYRGTLDDAVALRENEQYWLEVSADGGSGRKALWQLDVDAAYRRR